mgnify:CR=1 FL=1
METGSLWISVARAIAFGAAISGTAAGVGRWCGDLATLAPRNVPFRPPAPVFAIVWPCLYVTTGAAWMVAGATVDVPLAVVTLLCCAWLVLYVCLRKRVLAAASLALTAVIVVALAVHLCGPPRALLTPLGAWTAFAFYLNAYEVLADGRTGRR